MRRRWEGSERRRGARLESRCETFDRLGSQNANSGGIEEAGEKRKIPFYLLLYFVNPRRKERQVKSCPRRGRKWASTAGKFSCRSLIISLPVFQFFFKTQRIVLRNLGLIWLEKVSRISIRNNFYTCIWYLSIGEYKNDIVFCNILRYIRIVMQYWRKAAVGFILTVIIIIIDNIIL